MILQVILAALSLLGAVALAVMWYFKSNRQEVDKLRVYNALLAKHNSQVKLSIDDAEKRHIQYSKIAEKALSGELSGDLVDRVLSGKDPTDGK